MREREVELNFAFLLGSIDGTIIKRFSIKDAQILLEKKCNLYFTNPSKELIRRILKLTKIKHQLERAIENVKTSLYRHTFVEIPKAPTHQLLPQPTREVEYEEV